MYHVKFQIQLPIRYFLLFCDPLCIEKILYLIVYTNPTSILYLAAFWPSMGELLHQVTYFMKGVELRSQDTKFLL